MTAGEAPTRRRDAVRSRQALLEAARVLFDDRGFDRTTTRDIGERAGLDPTLIARYFGSKGALYLEILRTDFATEAPSEIQDLLEPGRITELLDRVMRRGAGPILDAALRRHPDPVIDAEAQSMFTERIVAPLNQRLAAPIGDQAHSDLRAEIIAAAFVGVALGRHSGAFPTLARTPSAEVANLLLRALNELAED